MTKTPDPEAPYTNITTVIDDGGPEPYTITTTVVPECGDPMAVFAQAMHDCPECRAARARGETMTTLTGAELQLFMKAYEAQMSPEMRRVIEEERAAWESEERESRQVRRARQRKARRSRCN